MSELVLTDEEYEIARLAVEEVLVELRDCRIFVSRNSGLCIRERDGTPSAFVRMGTETAISIGLDAVRKSRAGRAKPMSHVKIEFDKTVIGNRFHCECGSEKFFIALEGEETPLGAIDNIECIACHGMFTMTVRQAGHDLSAAVERLVALENGGQSND